MSDAYKNEPAGYLPKEERVVECYPLEGKSFPLKVKTFNKTCSYCPSQWDAESYDDVHIYIRYRWGCLTVSAAYNHESAVNSDNDIFFAKLGSEYHGEMPTEEMKEFTSVVLDFSNAIETTNFEELDE